MTDKEILDYFIDKKRGTIISSRINKNNIKKVPEMEEYLKHRYEEPYSSYCEVVARIYHSIDKKPTCSVCGAYKPYMGFKKPYSDSKWCSTKCQLRDKNFIKERNSKIDWKVRNTNLKKTLLEKYGDENYRNHNKAQETCLKRYGSKTVLTGKKREEIKKKIFEKYGKYSTTNTEAIKKTKFEKYGDPNFCNTKKMRETMMERYGCEYTLQSDELKNKVSSTKLLKYGDPAFINKEKAKQTLLEKYGVENPFQLDSVRNLIDYNKILDSKRKNGTFNSSAQENKLYEILSSIFKPDDIVKQYRDRRYCNKKNNVPYLCDFYIKSRDLFIELQGHYTHGDHPFNSNNKDDIKRLKFLQENSEEKPSYKKVIDVWTIADVEKRKVAEENNLNYVEIFGSSFDRDSVNKVLEKF